MRIHNTVKGSNGYENLTIDTPKGDTLPEAYLYAAAILEMKGYKVLTQWQGIK